MPAIQQLTVKAWGGRVETRVRVSGAGTPVLFIHGESGGWDPFLDALAEHHTIYAPEFPGTTPGQPDAIKAIDTLWDLVLYYDELLEALALPEVPIIGHSLGGMFAAEIAAHAPARASRLVLIAPAGLWLDTCPVPNWWSIPQQDLPRLTFAEPQSAAAQSFFAQPTQREEAVEALVARNWAMACATKFAWPIPDKGLKKRIHRIRAASLIIWGRQDGLIPPRYAEEFAARIPGSRTMLVDSAGHVPQLEQLSTVLRGVLEFIE